MYFRCFSFRGELGFLNCDDICVYVVNKQFDLLECVFDSVYVDLQLWYVCLCGVCSPWSVCQLVVVPYVVSVVVSVVCVVRM